MFYGVLPYGNERGGILGGTLNSHPLALKNLIPALTHFYIGGDTLASASILILRRLFEIEVEQTGASSQFYDKFSEYLSHYYMHSFKLRSNP